MKHTEHWTFKTWFKNFGYGLLTCGLVYGTMSLLLHIIDLFIKGRWVDGIIIIVLILITALSLAWAVYRQRD